MKRPKEKQTPIFSKLQDILREQSPAPISGEPFKSAEPPPSGQSEPEIPFPNPRVVPSWKPFLSQPGDPDLGKDKIPEATSLEVVTPKIILPKPEIEAVINSLGMAFVEIPAGTFIMGSPEYEAGRNTDEPQHEVTISRNFYLQTTPVTQSQWQAVIGPDPARSVPAEADLPVGGLNWQDCQLFINKLNEMGEANYRLPTEAEWEYACRAGSDTALANGELFNLYCELDSSLDEIGWYCGNSDRKPHPVGLKVPNAWGLYDMHGNIGEWCQDWYGSYLETVQIDPSGAISGPGRVVRGGSWFSSAKNCRAAARFHWPPQSRSQFHIIGFRLVRET